ncbi:uncharacterized protein LAJ45_07743 [Morchella importuna]|uniref:uncharacterized protein n=1 Tax=Morchella importuna TaxID=1174673 RepID=UPI001E8E37B2|nr:uncharacterized protein LAJ45_07743 [Morchella importuna]KAH8148290.1 hypothetical protein LAJ45_07743 [Morchella importuna]
MIYAGVITDTSNSNKELNTTYIGDAELVQIAKTTLFATKRLKERMTKRDKKATPLIIKYEPQKSDLIFFKPTTSNTPTPRHSVTIANEEIYPKDRLKYVRIWLDSNLFFRPHIEETIAKGLRILGQIRNIAYLPGTTVKSTHHLVIQGLLPTILWGLEAWYTGADHALRSLSVTGTVYTRIARIR